MLAMPSKRDQLRAICLSDVKAHQCFGEALRDVRHDVMYQIHFGADYSHGAYGWSLSLDNIKHSIAIQLDALKTDYIDYGFIHCQDKISDWKLFRRTACWLPAGTEKTGSCAISAWDLILRLLQKILDTGVVDMMMFSINPAYSPYQHGDFALGGRRT